MWRNRFFRLKIICVILKNKKLNQKWAQLPKLFLCSLCPPPHPMAAGHHLLFIWVPLWAVRPTCVLTCQLFFGTASGPPADLAQAAAQGGFGASGFQLPWPVCQGICSGLFEADEVGEGFWGAKLHSFCSQDKRTPRGKSWTHCMPWISGQIKQSDFWRDSLAAK